MLGLRLLLVALVVMALGGCGDEAPRSDGVWDRPIILYHGFPGLEDAPLGGKTSLDPETGLPRRSLGCMAIPGDEARAAAHNARLRAACARGELRAHRLDHKFTQLDSLYDRFDQEGGVVLAPDSPTEISDGRFRIEVRLEENRYWQGYVQPRGGRVRRNGLDGRPGEEWRVLFDHDDTTMLVKKADHRFEVHDLPTREIVQIFHGR